VRAVIFIVLASCAPVTFDVTARSHAVLDAYDRGDVDAIANELAPGFVQFEGSPHDRDETLARLRAAKLSHIAKRTFSHEHAYKTDDDAVYVGQAAERGDGNRGSYIYDGDYMFAWHREHGRWKLALWTWRAAGEIAERDTWNEIFKHDVGFEHAPNKLLVDSVANVTPGEALDVAMGQGRNALYLASRGWHVTGVDWSSEGIEHAQAEAKQHHLALETVQTDISRFDFGVAKWDLVTMIYAGNDKAWLAKIKDAIKPGGFFVAEYFHDAKHGGATNVSGDLDGFATGELAAIFGDSFEILRDEVVDDVPDWATDRASLVRFVARKR
jgi:SAM-dependent methyltransferase